MRSATHDYLPLQTSWRYPLIVASTCPAYVTGETSCACAIRIKRSVNSKQIIRKENNLLEESEQYKSACYVETTYRARCVRVPFAVVKRTLWRRSSFFISSKENTVRVHHGKVDAPVRKQKRKPLGEYTHIACKSRGLKAPLHILLRAKLQNQRVVTTCPPRWC